jgi:hypothetical protein
VVWGQRGPYIYIYKANQTLAPKGKEILVLSNGHLGVDLLIRKGREYPFFRLVSTLTFYKKKKEEDNNAIRFKIIIFLRNKQDSYIYIYILQITNYKAIYIYKKYDMLF